MRSPRILLLGASVFLLTAFADAAFAPFEQWRTAVTTGDKAALTGLYMAATATDEAQFWSALKSAGFTGINPKALQITANASQARLLLRVEAVKDGEAVVASALQIWEHQADGWHIMATRHSDFSPAPARRLPQPATPNPNLYPEPNEAQAELKAAAQQAATENKRLLVVFGANWCYDCHVLDTTFRSKDFAPLVDPNYIVVHINIGDEGKDNNDLAARLGVALNKGIPSLAVLDPNGTVLVAQKNGEFESTVKIGPDEVRAFLEKWKPSRK